MTSANPDDERELRSLPPRRIAGAIIVSLSVHGAALLGLMRMTMSDADAHMAADPPSISVALVTRTPRLPPPEPPEPEPPIDPELSTREIPLETAETVMSPETELAEAQEPALPPEAGEAAPLISDAQDFDASAASQPPGQQGDDDDATAPWTPARIRAAFDAGRGERQSEATADWLTACFLEQKQRGTRDCTQQQQALDYATDDMRAGRAAAAGSFASVTRPQLQARLSEQFRIENLRLAELMEEGGEVGALASQRYYINLEYFRYLNGNGQEPLFSAMQNFSADVLGGSSLSLPGNVPFTCSKRSTSFAIGEKGKATGVPTPCIYEWTGFTIERPETDDADTFRVVPVVPYRDAGRFDDPVKP